MNKKTLYSDSVREKLLSGINKITNAVSVTLGPTGRNVLIAGAMETNYTTVCLPIEVTKDGYKVSQRFDLMEDFFERAGVNLVKECAQRTVDQAGDGTTSTVILMRQMVADGIKAINEGANPMELKREIDAAIARVVAILKARAISIGSDNDKIYQVAMISANNDPEIGKIIADAFKKIGHQGVVDIQGGKTINTEIKIAAGYRFDRSWVHPYFMNKPEKQIVEYDNPLILLYNRNINHPTQIEKALRIALETQRPLLIVCPDATDQGLGYLLGNVMKKNIVCCVVKAPGIGDSQREEMEDIAKITGATFMADNRGDDIKKIELRHFGSAKKVVVSREDTVIIDGDSDKEELENLLNELKMNKAKAKNEEEAAPIERRIAKLTGGVAVIHVGAATDTEMKEKMDRYDDSVRAVKSAIAEGYTVGGGTALMRIRSGNKIVDSALDSVLRQICFNVGLRYRKWWEVWKAKHVFDQVRDAKGNIGYNAKSGKIEDLIEAGVIDPVKVLRCALQNAASSATMVLTTECIIADTY
jgi:chaperonin GroEL